MKEGGGVHTTPVPDSPRWCNKVDGRVWSRHRSMETAVEAGRVIAHKLGVEQTIDQEDGLTV